MGSVIGDNDAIDTLHQRAKSLEELHRRKHEDLGYAKGHILLLEDQLADIIRSKGEVASAINLLENTWPS